MIEIAALAGCLVAVLLGIAAIVAVVLFRSMWNDGRDARTSELNAYKAKTAAENQSTADKIARANAEGVAQKAIAALKVYEAKPSTPETERVTTDPDHSVVHRADDLERLLNLP